MVTIKVFLVILGTMGEAEATLKVPAISEQVCESASRGFNNHEPVRLEFYNKTGITVIDTYCVYDTVPVALN